MYNPLRKGLTLLRNITLQPHLSCTRLLQHAGYTTISVLLSLLLFQWELLNDFTCLLRSSFCCWPLSDKTGFCGDASYRTTRHLLSRLPELNLWNDHEFNSVFPSSTVAVCIPNPSCTGLLPQCNRSHFPIWIIDDLSPGFLRCTGLLPQWTEVIFQSE